MPVMVKRAEPADLKRARIVIVVSVNLLGPTNLARLTLDLSVAHCIAQRGLRPIGLRVFLPPPFPDFGAEKATMREFGARPVVCLDRRVSPRSGADLSLPAILATPHPPIECEMRFFLAALCANPVHPCHRQKGIWSSSMSSTLPRPPERPPDPPRSSRRSSLRSSSRPPPLPSWRPPRSTSSPP